MQSKSLYLISNCSSTQKYLSVKPGRSEDRSSTLATEAAYYIISINNLMLYSYVKFIVV